MDNPVPAHLPWSEVLDCLIDTMPTAAFYKGWDDRYLGSNPAFAALLGVPRSEIVGKTFLEVVPSALVPLDGAADPSGPAAPGLRGGEARIVTPIGETRDLLFRQTPLRAPDGRVLGVLGTAEDITLQKKAIRLRRLYDALLAANRAVVQAADRQTLFERICATCVESGFRLACVAVADGEAIKPVAAAGVTAYLDGASFSTRDDIPTGRGPAGLAMRTGRPYIANDFLADPATAPWWDRARAHGLAAAAIVPFSEGDRISGVIAFYAGRSGFFGADEVALIEQFAATISRALDRLAAEQAGQRLTRHPLVRAILDAVPAPVLVAHDSEGKVITGNRTSERLLGIPPDGNLSKCGAPEQVTHFQHYRNGIAIPPEDLPMQRAAAGEVVAEDELELRFRDGRSVFIQGNAVPIRDAGGAAIGAVGAFLDITQRRKGEAALAEARDIAERAVAAKARFMASASHDLRQPLQGLVLMHDVLEQRLPPDLGGILAKVRSCTTTLCEMVDDLLDVAKLDAGIIVVDKRVCTIDDLVAELLPAHAAAATAKGLRLRHVASRLAVRTDPALMRRILGNLLANAVKYTRHGGVVLGCRRRGQLARIEVWDSGIGIPADQLTNVFEEFLQLDNPERAREKGSGLGLAIVDRSARLLGVKVRVRSIPGRGSCFAVEVPLA